MEKRKSKKIDGFCDNNEIGFIIDTDGAVAVEPPRYSRGIASGLSKEKDEVEEKLEEILFGKQPFRQAVGKEEKSNYKTLNSESGSEDSDSNLGKEEARQELSVSLAVGRRPAWQDEDDDTISVDIAAHARTRKLRQTVDETMISGTSYSKRLRTQYEKLLAQPEWAVRPSKPKKQCRIPSGTDDSSDEEEGMLQRTGDLLKVCNEHLSKGMLDLKRMKDANSAKRAEAVVKAVEFHPTANVILVAGFHKTLDLFQVDGQTNPKLQSIHVQGFPISTAHFTQDGTEVVLAGRKKKFFVYDMIAGKVTPVFGIRGRDERYFDRFVVSPDNQYLVFLGRNGYMLLVSNKTKQWVGELKMNGNVLGLSFTPDSRFMLSTGSEGKVYVWDMATRQCVHSFIDDGCIHGTRVSVSPDQRYVACGSDSGVVNVYAGEQCLSSSGASSTQKPLKALMNLTTGIDSICINPTSELMVMASQRKKDALRVVHLPSLTVFSNWPSNKSPLDYVSAVAISPHSKYMAIGNAKGKVLLYRINHYSQHKEEHSTSLSSAQSAIKE